ncbi:hypothetical protein [Streptomyces achromogenes]|uniref:hypothetical protein n=1 Tax=Streptomyces achromogenes TaxID=67255 RepID=UPI00369CE855
MTSNPGLGRYHLLLAVGGRPVQHGWWDSEATARQKFKRWVGDWGRAGARITLDDEETGIELAAWPGIVGAES